MFPAQIQHNRACRWNWLWLKRKAKENYKRTVNKKSKENSQPGESLYFGLKNQQEWRIADHNGSTDVSTTPLLGVLDTNHHVSQVCMHAAEQALLEQPGRDRTGLPLSLEEGVPCSLSVRSWTGASAGQPCLWLWNWVNRKNNQQNISASWTLTFSYVPYAPSQIRITLIQIRIHLIDLMRFRILLLHINVLRIYY